MGRSICGVGAAGTEKGIRTEVATYLPKGDLAGIGGGRIGERNTDSYVGGNSEQIRCEGQ